MCNMTWEICCQYLYNKNKEHIVYAAEYKGSTWYPIGSPWWAACGFRACSTNGFPAILGDIQLVDNNRQFLPSVQPVTSAYSGTDFLRLFITYLISQRPQRSKESASSQIPAQLATNTSRFRGRIQHLGPSSRSHVYCIETWLPFACQNLCAEYAGKDMSSCRLVQHARDRTAVWKEHHLIRYMSTILHTK